MKNKIFEILNLPGPSLCQDIFAEGKNKVLPLVLHSSKIILSGLLWIFEETVFGCVASVGPGQKKGFHSRSGLVQAAAQPGFHDSISHEVYSKDMVYFMTNVHQKLSIT